MLFRDMAFGIAAGIAVLASGRVSAVEPGASEPASQRAEPGVVYGHDPKVPLATTVLFSAPPEEIAADAEEWKRHGVGAFFVDYIAGDWSTDIWAADGEPWTIGESDKSFQKVRAATEACRKIGSETFLKMHYAHTMEWFNDIAWQRIDNNFRQFAVFARETGCTGLAIDIEYIVQQYSFDWEGYDYKGYTRQDLIKKVRERMTRVLGILYDEFPDMVFITFPEEGFNLGGHIQAAWIEEAARRNAPGGLHYFTETTYRNTNIKYMFAFAWACNEVFHRMLSPTAWKYWTEKCSIAEGLWPYGFDYQNARAPGISLEEYRQGIAGSMMVSRRYNWLFSHTVRDQFIGRNLDQYKGTADLPAYVRALSGREMATNQEYIKLAAELRDLKLADYSQALGLIPAPSFAGPAETPIISLVPRERANAAEIKNSWDMALRYFQGEEIDLHAHYDTQTKWMIIGPFDNAGAFEGHNAVYPPEKEIALDAEYDGLKGKVRWTEYKATEGYASVNLAGTIQPAEHASAYAVCFVSTPEERQVQFRVGTNDAGKMWIGGKLVMDYPSEGTATLDREIIPVTLPKGTTPVLLKISNNLFNWGFVLRVTDSDGNPAEGLDFSLSPAGK